MKSVVFWGGTSQAKTLRGMLPKEMKLVAIFDNNPKVQSPFIDVPLYHGLEGFQKWKHTLKDKEVYFAVAIGGDRGLARVEIGNFLEQEGLKPYNIIHSNAQIAKSAHLGKGVQILSGAVIDADVSIGDYSIINLSASIAHETIIGKGVHISVGANIAGCNNIGDYVTIYVGADLAPRLHIAEGAVIGIGSVVLKDVEQHTLVYGNPAKYIKDIDN